MNGTSKKRCNSWAGVVLIGCALLPRAAFARPKEDPLSSKQGATALNFARQVNAAERTFLHAHGRYATIAELVKVEQQERTTQGLPPSPGPLETANLQSEPVPGFHFRFIIASDGSAYEMSLRELGVSCGYSLFSNEGGVLYEGKTLDCAAATPMLASWAPPDVDQAVPPVRTDVPCPLPQLLKQASQKVEELSDNLQRFSAREQIEHMESPKRGHLRTMTKRTFNYVAQITETAGAPSVEEYRKGSEPEVGSDTAVYDTGSAAFALIFHPSYIADFQMTCEGLADSAAGPAWQLHFVQRPDRPNQFHVLQMDNRYFPLPLKGRAWISADTYQVLRMETDLLEPARKARLDREHLVIEYGPVDFRKGTVRLWLPQLTDLYVDYHGHRYQRRHKFSDFQLFWVDSAQVIKPPKADADAPKN